MSSDTTSNEHNIAATAYSIVLTVSNHAAATSLANASGTRDSRHFPAKFPVTALQLILSVVLPLLNLPTTLNSFCLLHQLLASLHFCFFLLLHFACCPLLLHTIMLV